MTTIEQLYAEMNEAFLATHFAELGPVIPGEGKTVSPRLMLIGEAPGAQEKEMGRPFVGKAGKNLNDFLTAIGLRREDIYITNTVKIRPTRISSSGNTVNRPPAPAEKQWFHPWLMAEVSLICPEIIVTLGNVALQAFVSATVGERHGKIIGSEENRAGIPLFPLYHPASVIYNPALKEVYFRDLETLSELL